MDMVFLMHRVLLEYNIHEGNRGYEAMSKHGFPHANDACRIKCYF